MEIQCFWLGEGMGAIESINTPTEKTWCIPHRLHEGATVKELLFFK